MVGFRGFLHHSIWFFFHIHELFLESFWRCSLTEFYDEVLIQRIGLFSPVIKQRKMSYIADVFWEWSTIDFVDNLSKFSYPQFRRQHQWTSLDNLDFFYRNC